MKNTSFQRLIIRKLKGEASKEELKILSKELASSSEKRQMYEAFLLTWDFTGQTDIEMPRIEKFNKNSLPGYKKANNHWFKIAASLLIVLLSALGIMYIINPFNTTYLVETGQVQKEITLPDNSKVVLNRNSSLSYEKPYDRKLNLKGEAYFEVSKTNDKKRFTVQSENTTITVLGTVFTVNTNKNQDEVRLIEGKVMAENIAGKKIILKPGEMLEVNTLSMKKSAFDNNNFLAWKTGELHFQNDELSEVIEIIENLYGVEITTYNEKLLNCRITTSYSKVSLDEVLKELEIIFNIEYTRENNKITITRGGC